MSNRTTCPVCGYEQCLAGCFGAHTQQAQLAQQSLSQAQQNQALANQTAFANQASQARAQANQANALGQQGSSGQSLGSFYGIQRAAEPLQGQRVTELRPQRPKLMETVTFESANAKEEALVAAAQRAAEFGTKPAGLDSELAIRMRLEAECRENGHVHVRVDPARDGLVCRHCETFVVRGEDLARMGFVRLTPGFEYDPRANRLADEAQTLRDENTRLLAENARLRRGGRGR